MRVAIVSDPMSFYGGAERVIEQLLAVFPHADVFALVDALDTSSRAFLGGRPVKTSFIQRLPFSPRRFRAYLALWPIAVEQFDLSAYDLVLCSHFAVAHGAVTGPGQVQLAYTHSPMRYAWDLRQEYLEEMGLTRGPRSWVVRSILHRLRTWDCVAAARVDHFIANSSFVAERITKFYRRSSEVIHPPVCVDRFRLVEDKADFYLTAGRIVPYKRVDLIVDAFARMPDRRLVVIGEGRDLARLRARAPANVSFLGRVHETQLIQLMGQARAFIFAGIEDFGIAPVEAQASGTPVVAFGRGGLTDTIRGLDQDPPTGVFFLDQTVEAIVEAVEAFEINRRAIHPVDCRKSAMRFSSESFRVQLHTFVQRAISGPPPRNRPAAAETIAVSPDTLEGHRRSAAAWCDREEFMESPGEPRG